MALLIAICGAVGVVSYASMDAFLTRQLDAQLSQAAERANDPGRPPQGGFNGRDPLDARGQSVGTVNASIRNGQVNTGGFLASDTTRTPLAADDKPVLLGLATDGKPVDRELSNGSYRLVAVETSFGDVLVTGLPLAVKDSTLTSLVWTFVFVSLGGLLLVGLIGTVLIRRTMKPLEQLSEVATQGLPTAARRRRGGTRGARPAVELQSGNRGGQRGARAEPHAGQRGQCAAGEAEERDQGAPVCGGRLA